MSSCCTTLTTGAAMFVSIAFLTARRSRHRHRGACLHASQYVEDTRTSGFGPQCGDELTVLVSAITDCGVFGTAHKRGDMVDVFMPSEAFGRPRKEYRKGMELQVTVIRPALPNKRKHEVKVTDRPLLPLSGLKQGRKVDGRVVNISNVGILLDIGFAKDARCWWRHLKVRSREPSSYQVGDILKNLKVGLQFPTWVQVVPEELELRPLRSLKIGEQFSAMVLRVSPKAQGIFLEVDATDNVAAFKRHGNLAKRIEDYKLGEELQVEVIRVTRDRVDVKQVH